MSVAYRSPDASPTPFLTCKNLEFLHTFPEDLYGYKANAATVNYEAHHDPLITKPRGCYSPRSFVLSNSCQLDSHNQMELVLQWKIYDEASTKKIIKKIKNKK